jgi:hypothetical protein
MNYTTNTRTIWVLNSQECEKLTNPILIRSIKRLKKYVKNFKAFKDRENLDQEQKSL